MANINSLLIQVQGRLFEAVQSQGIFKDSKCFIDAVPKYDTHHILKEYDLLSADPSFSLKAFVLKRFIFPKEKQEPTQESDIEAYLQKMWDGLSREFTPIENSSQIALPHPHIVPGGRFRESYYWDSYFTALGLIVHKREDLLVNMIENFAYLIDTFGHIPNGNRCYYLSRSQQPFFSHLIMLLEQVGKDPAFYFSHLEKEYLYWMGEKRLSKIQGHTLNHYYDYKVTPREEGYKEDLALNLKEYRDIRAACESGWDFSSRWLKDGINLNTIHTTNILPVDLNCLLFHMEQTLSTLAKRLGFLEKSLLYQLLAKRRQEAIDALLWDEERGFYFDYFIKEDKRSPHYTMAGVYPLFVKIASDEQASSVKSHLEKNFLSPGGLKTTLNKTSQQWDGANGWAPLQWIGYLGLKNYQYNGLANLVAKRWTTLNENIFSQIHLFVEKYQVEELSTSVQDGEYTLQEGFGWSNGVYLKFKQELDLCHTDP